MSWVTNHIGVESQGNNGYVFNSDTLFKADWPASTNLALFSGSSMWDYYAAAPISVTGGTLPNLYGLYIEPMQITNVTAGWGIYQAGTADRNYFAGDTTFGAAVSLAGSKVSSLPACSSTIEGTMRYVTDAGSSPIYNATVVGGGSAVVPVFCNGTEWTYH
ncbi:MAG: hypothetical protein JO358_19970 [Alphaproteobacteria bacterium]|nr:hypothetical protein [Alphaproteobacteria bacterium]